MQKRVFVTWCGHGSRAKSLAYYLDAKNYFVQTFSTKSKFLALFKYLGNAFETWHILKREKPDIIFVANPPVFAVLVIWIYRLFHSCVYVVDTHSGAFTAKRWSKFLWLYRFLSKRAFLNVLHNKPMEEKVAEWGARTSDLGDIFYLVPTNKTYPFRRGFNVVFVCVYSGDEPLEEVIETARKMPSINFYITGPLKRAPKNIVEGALENVIFTDFLPDEEYNALLRGCDIVISLTKNDYTMQNGAYEAIALGRPVITSNWPVLRRIYHKGAICIDNSAESLIGAIKTIQKDYDRYVQEINELRSEFQLSWEEKYSKLSELLIHWKDQR